MVTAMRELWVHGLAWTCWCKALIWYSKWVWRLIDGCWCRDKSVIVWQLTREDKDYGYAKRRLTGHSHFVEDVVISSDGLFALSGSWDSTLRLWNLKTGATERRFLGHTKDVLSVAFSADNRQVYSAVIVMISVALIMKSVPLFCQAHAQCPTCAWSVSFSKAEESASFGHPILNVNQHAL